MGSRGQSDDSAAVQTRNPQQARREPGWVDFIGAGLLIRPLFSWLFRLGVLVAVIVGVLLTVIAGFMAIDQSGGQYFVGAADDGEVAIFQGLREETLGLPLRIRSEGSCPEGDTGCEKLFIDDLEESARMDVIRGMNSDTGLEEARDIIGRLRSYYLLPSCQEVGIEAGTTARGADQQQPRSSELPLEPQERPPELPLEPGVDCRTVR